MATAQMDTVIRHLRRTVLRQDAAGRTDGQLLASFIDQKDEAAFEALVRRHGPMVFGVCRRLVGNHHDAEDAFQATFLVLARKAASVRPRERVANWLHGVALRTAMKAKTMTEKRRGREKQVTEMPEPEAAQQDHWRDLQPLLDQELNGLPENYRLPILLCELEGKTIKDAAQQLGWPQGSLAGRLARGRKLLAKRLASRGVVLSAGSLATVVSQKVASAGVPTSLMSSTVKAAAMIAAGQATVAGVVPAKVAVLTEGVLKTMLLTKLKIVAVLLVVAALGGTAGVICRTQAEEPLDTQQAQEKSTPKAENGKTENRKPDFPVKVDEGKRITVEVEEQKKLQGSWTPVSWELSGEKMPNESIELLKITFKGDRLVYNHKHNPTETFTYKIDADQTPHRLNLIWSNGPLKGETTTLIYEFDGETLRLSNGNAKQMPGTITVKRAEDGEVKHGAKQDAPKTDLDRLQGIWSVVSIEEGGKPAKLEKAVFMVDGKRACWQTSESEMQGGLYLDPASKPKTYDFVMSERTMEGIYSLDGDTLRLCYDVPEATRVVGFTTAKGSHQVLFVLKRIHGPEVFPYRLADGSRAFPPVIERVKKATPPAKIAPTPKDNNNYDLDPTVPKTKEPPATKSRQQDFPIKAGDGQRITVPLNGPDFPVKFTENGPDFPVKFTEGRRITVESDPAQSGKPTEKDMHTNVKEEPTGKLLFGASPNLNEEMKKLQGTWRLVGGFYGKHPQIPGVAAGEGILKTTDITIDGNEWIGWTRDGKKQKVVFRVDGSESLDIKDDGFASGLEALGLRADAVNAPKRIDINEVGGDLAHGIYGLGGDDLVIRLLGSGNKGRPTQFAMTTENGVLLFYKRIKHYEGKAQ